MWGWVEGGRRTALYVCQVKYEFGFKNLKTPSRVYLLKRNSQNALPPLPPKYVKIPPPPRKNRMELGYFANLLLKSDFFDMRFCPKIRKYYIWWIEA